MQPPFRALGQRDITAVPAHNRAGDGHTKPDAALLKAAYCFEPYKRFEDALHIRCSDTRAIVVDGNTQYVPLLGERHPGPLAVGDSVLDQVAERPPEAHRATAIQRLPRACEGHVLAHVAQVITHTLEQRVKIE